MDVRINKEEWDALDKAGKESITEIVTGFFKGAKIIPDPNAPRSAKSPGPQRNPFCEAACNIAENAAKALCFKLGEPGAIAVCIAIAEQAGRECRNRC